MTSAADASLIAASLEHAGERGVDLTPAVYARLFAARPELKPLFVLDTNGAVRGAMLAHVFDTIFDFVGERRYSHRFIAAEIVTHEGYNVPPDAFAAFFGVVRDEVRAACGPKWTAEMDAAWQRLLSDLDCYVANPTGT